MWDPRLDCRREKGQSWKPWETPVAQEAGPQEKLEVCNTIASYLCCSYLGRQSPGKAAGS